MTLQVSGMRKSYGGLMVLDDVRLEVPAGGLVGLIGPNGAGKSTLFAVISGFQAAEAGSIAFDGVPLDGLSPQQRVRRGLGRTFQVPREFHRMSVRDNVMAAAPHQSGEALLSLFFRPGRVRAEERSVRERADRWLSFLGLESLADEPAAQLSGGQKKLLELGRALMVEPRCILLDEPFAGVNPVLIKELGRMVRELNERGIAFLIVEHNLEALSRLVGTLYVMDRGRILACGEPNVVLRDATVREAYLGGVV